MKLILSESCSSRLFAKFSSHTHLWHLQAHWNFCVPGCRARSDCFAWKSSGGVFLKIWAAHRNIKKDLGTMWSHQERPSNTRWIRVGCSARSPVTGLCPKPRLKKYINALQPHTAGMCLRLSAILFLSLFWNRDTVYCLIKCWYHYGWRFFCVEIALFANVLEMLGKAYRYVKKRKPYLTHDAYKRSACVRPSTSFKRTSHGSQFRSLSCRRTSTQTISMWPKQRRWNKCAPLLHSAMPHACQRMTVLHPHTCSRTTRTVCLSHVRMYMFSPCAWIFCFSPDLSIHPWTMMSPLSSSHNENNPVHPHHHLFTSLFHHLNRTSVKESDVCLQEVSCFLFWWYIFGPFAIFFSYMCVCMHACMYVWLYVWLYVCMCVCMYVCMRTNAFFCLHHLAGILQCPA